MKKYISAILPWVTIFCANAQDEPVYKNVIYNVTTAFKYK